MIVRAAARATVVACREFALPRLPQACRISRPFAASEEVPMTTTDPQADAAIAPAPQVPHFSVDERAARGRAARADAPRASHSALTTDERAEPVEVLDE